MAARNNHHWVIRNWAAIHSVYIDRTKPMWIGSSNENKAKPKTA